MCLFFSLSISFSLVSTASLIHQAYPGLPLSLSIQFSGRCRRRLEFEKAAGCCHMEACGPSIVHANWSRGPHGNDHCTMAHAPSKDTGFRTSAGLQPHDQPGIPWYGMPSGCVFFCFCAVVFLFRSDALLFVAYLRNWRTELNQLRSFSKLSGCCPVHRKTLTCECHGR